MTKAYILLIHKNPEQVLRLITRLDDPESSFFIHIDKKADAKSFQNLKSYPKNKIHYIERHNGRWGGVGIVLATIAALKKIKETGGSYDRIILLSGQDYPLKSNAYIDEFLQRSEHSIFMTTFSALPIANWDNGGYNRIYDYYFGLRKPHLYLNRIFNAVKDLIPPFRKTIPYDLTVYAGSQWWIIDFYALNYILSFLETHPKLISFFKYSLLSDEMFFQTILLNADDPKLLKSIKNDNVRLIVIPEKGIHPIIWTDKDAEILLNSSALFARKFDVTVNSSILSVLDMVN
jgi:hypothetical protein